MKRAVASLPYLCLEFGALVAGLPLALSTVIPIRYLLPALWLAALYCLLIRRMLPAAPERIRWRWEQVAWPQLRPVLLRFALCTALIGAIAALWRPEWFLSLIRERPLFWALVMVAYPLLSVVPQEFVFRGFFFQRYGRLFPGRHAMTLASGVAFGAAHLIFQNWVAPLMCLAGGLFFAGTYASTRSLALVAIEHALYGCMIFTVGLGAYFYHGAVA